MEQNEKFTTREHDGGAYYTVDMVGRKRPVAVTVEKAVAERLCENLNDKTLESGILRALRNEE